MKKVPFKSGIHPFEGKKYSEDKETFKILPEIMDKLN